MRVEPREKDASSLRSDVHFPHTGLKNIPPPAPGYNKGRKEGEEGGGRGWLRLGEVEEEKVAQSPPPPPPPSSVRR